MADVAESPTERKPRKSVAFSEGATIVDSDGQVTESADVNGRKNSAESHAAGWSPPGRLLSDHENEGNIRRHVG
jgi:translation initiation factor 2 subunit 2